LNSASSRATERGAAVAAWALGAGAVIYMLPTDMWPYALSKQQMGQMFVMFLPLGAVA
jgi:hypothetical protein